MNSAKLITTLLSTCSNAPDLYHVLYYMLILTPRKYATQYTRQCQQYTGGQANLWNLCLVSGDSERSWCTVVSWDILHEVAATHVYVTVWLRHRTVPFCSAVVLVKLFIGQTGRQFVQRFLPQLPFHNFSSQINTKPETLDMSAETSLSIEIKCRLPLSGSTTVSVELQSRLNYSVAWNPLYQNSSRKIQRIYRCFTRTKKHRNFSPL